MNRQVASVAAALLQARRQQQPVDAAPLEALLQSADEAYAVQAEVARGSGWFGEDVPRHWKSGGPSRAAVLTHALLPPQHVLRSPADMRGIPFNVRWIEAEVALCLARDVSPAHAARLPPGPAGALVEAMAVSIEIVDSRWRQARSAAPLLKLADLQSHGALVLGAWTPYEARDWAAQRCEVRIGDGPPQTFTGTHSLADPAWLLPQWLQHVTRHGATVPQGTVVSTGTWCGLLEARPGDTVRVAFDGIGEAEVRL